MTKTTPRIICPYCEDGRAFIWSAASKHVKAKHPEEWEDFKKKKEYMLKTFACDESGNPIGGSPEPKPEPELTPATEPKPKPEPKTPAPEVKPPEPKPEPKPEPTPKPAEEGGFLDNLRRDVFGD